MRLEERKCRLLNGAQFRTLPEDRMDSPVALGRNATAKTKTLNTQLRARRGSS